MSSRRLRTTAGEAGVSYGELAGNSVSRRGLFVRAVFFVDSFSLGFMALGALFSTAGLALSGA